MLKVQCFNMLLENRLASDLLLLPPDITLYANLILHRSLDRLDPFVDTRHLTKVPSMSHEWDLANETTTNSVRMTQVSDFPQLQRCEPPSLSFSFGERCCRDAFEIQQLVASRR